MTRSRAITLTDEILARLADVEHAYENYLPGGESASVVELPKLAFADAVLRAVAEQAARAGERSLGATANTRSHFSRSRRSASSS